MPGGNGTEPMGQGPMTGRGMGHCAAYNKQGFMNMTGGFGRGCGRGGGWGWRSMSADSIVDQRLGDIRQRLAELEKKQGKV